MGHPKRPTIINARITEEYVICGVCLTKNRIVSHNKVFRPLCGRCGYPLPDPFGVQSRSRLLREWIARHRPALAAITGLLVVGLLMWVASGKRGHSSALSGRPTQDPVSTLLDHRGVPVHTVAVVVRQETSTDTNDKSNELPPRLLPSEAGWQSDGRYGLGTPNMETWGKSESVVIVIDVCAGRAEADFPASGGHDGAWSGVLISSHLEQVKGNPLNLLVGPQVVERIYINTGLGLSG